MSEHLPFTRYGPLDVPGGDDLISRFLREFGEWSFHETEFVRGLLRPGVRILDGGAFVGTFSLGVAGSAPAMLVAAEANPTVLPLLQQNFARLAPPGFVIEHGVLGDGRPFEGAVPQYAIDNLGSLSFASGSADLSQADVASAEGIVPAEVADARREFGAALPGLSLAQLRERHGPFDLIKLDIEGAELAALRTDAEWLREFKPMLWLECNETSNVFSLYEFVADLGYELHYFTYSSYNPSNHRRNPSPVFPVAYEAGLLASRPGTPVSMSAELMAHECDLIRVNDAAHLRACLWVTPRWGLAEWAQMPRSRLLALVSRLYRQEAYDRFLDGP